MKNRTAVLLGLAAVGGAAVAAFVRSSDPDREFIAEAGPGGRLEVQLGHVAVQNGLSQDVKDFGERMIIDHGKANRELLEIAQRIDKPVPAGYTAKQRSLLEQLRSLYSGEFDRSYMEHMTLIHGRDVELFKKAANKLRDPDLRSWARNTLPVLEQHLNMAKQIAYRLDLEADTLEKRGIRAADETARRRFAA